MPLTEDILKLDDSNFESAVNANASIVVDFWAPWCGPCRMLAPVVESLAKDYKGKVVFAKLDTDESPRTAMSLGISSIPTLIFFRGGKQVDRLTGAHPRSNIETVLKKHLL
jgi:thioredoxin 1